MNEKISRINNVMFKKIKIVPIPNLQTNLWRLKIRYTIL